MLSLLGTFVQLLWRGGGGWRQSQMLAGVGRLYPFQNKFWIKKSHLSAAAEVGHQAWENLLRFVAPWGAGRVFQHQHPTFAGQVSHQHELQKEDSSEQGVLVVWVGGGNCRSPGEDRT